MRRRLYLAVVVLIVLLLAFGGICARLVVTGRGRFAASSP